MEVGARSDAHQITSDEVYMTPEDDVDRSGSRQEGNIYGSHAFVSCGH